MLEVAIESAQIFDDTFEKNHSPAKAGPTRTNVTSTSMKFVLGNNKCKDVGGRSKDTSH